jgi:hypothetical protein
MTSTRFRRPVSTVRTRWLTSLSASHIPANRIPWMDTLSTTTKVGLDNNIVDYPVVVDIPASARIFYFHCLLTGGIMHQYQLKVVPTRYISQGQTLESHQFAITYIQKDIMAGASGIPGLFFQYEFSPLMVQYEERQRCHHTDFTCQCHSFPSII